MDCKWIVSGLGQSTFGRWIGGLKWIDVDWNVIIGRRGVRHMTNYVEMAASGPLSACADETRALLDV